MNTESLYRTITANKLFFSGLAILGICLSHLIGADKGTPYWAVFYPGFVGVDIFLFLSGYGLCRSFENNTLRTFYVRRIKRIYPLLVIFTIFLYALIYFGKHTSFAAFDVFCNLTTLHFWRIGGHLAEWYLSFILYLYLLFPLLYNFIRKWGFFAIVTTFLALFIFLYSYHTGWLLQCAASRIPIFLFGIYCYQQNSSKAYFKGTCLFVLMLLPMTLLFVQHIVQKFELVYLSAPVVMLLLAYVFQPTIKSAGKTYSVISILGKYSLEIYLSNMLILNVLKLIDLPCPVVLTYIAMHLIFVPVMVYLNNITQKLLNSL